MDVLSLHGYFNKFYIMKGGKPTNKVEEKSKYLYAEPKFMVPPDALKLPEPFKSILRKE